MSLFRLQTRKGFLIGSRKGVSMSIENLKAKQAIIDEIKGKLDKAESAVVIDYLGTTVEQANAMRKKLREANVDYTVYKNTMMARAIVGTKFEALKEILEGPSAIAISYDDAILPARILAGVMKEYNKMTFKAGIVEGVFYDEAGVKALASIPSRDELIAKFLGSIQSPVGKFVRTLQAVADAKPQAGGAVKAVESAPAEAAESVEAPVEVSAAEPAETPAAE